MQAGENLQAEVQSVIDDVIKALESMQRKPLRGQKLKILELCLRSEKSVAYPEMARKIGGKPGSLKQAGAALRQILQVVTGKVIRDKNDIRPIILTWHQEKEEERNTRIIGRHAALDTLSDAITGHCRLICVYGSPSIGKTQLVTALRQRLMGINKDDSFFELELLWEKIDQGATIDDLYRDVRAAFSNDVVIDQLDAAAGLKQILCQQNQRLLLVIDKTDSIYNPNKSDASFKQDDISQGFERWLQLLTQTYDLYSCVIWVARRRPSCLLVSSSHVHRQQLKPLQKDESIKLLQENLSKFPDQDLSELAEFCGRNPGVLRLTSLKMGEERYSSVSQIMDMPLRPEKYREDRLWIQALETLAAMEQHLLGWLLLPPSDSIERDITAAFHDKPHSLRDMLSDLQNRGFVDHNS